MEWWMQYRTANIRGSRIGWERKIEAMNWRGSEKTKDKKKEARYGRELNSI